jgi:anaphase-promoting complex subunit 11|tara:strand:+ start:27948 stop:28319 length:372 start_codon:yes stop_codon:yes gene_type:complete
MDARSSPRVASSSSAPAPTTGLALKIKTWHGVGAWTWGAGDVGDVCGICRIAFDGCPPDAKFPGDDSPVVWGECGHAFHLQCITKWLGGTAGREAARCPICRGAWEFKELEGAGGGGGEGNGA